MHGPTKANIWTEETSQSCCHDPTVGSKRSQETNSKTYSPVAVSCTELLLPSPPECRHRGKFNAGTLLKVSVLPQSCRRSRGMLLLLGPSHQEIPAARSRRASSGVVLPSS